MAIYTASSGTETMRIGFLNRHQTSGHHHHLPTNKDRIKTVSNPPISPSPTPSKKFVGSTNTLKVYIFVPRLAEIDGIIRASNGRGPSTTKGSKRHHGGLQHSSSSSLNQFARGQLFEREGIDEQQEGYAPHGAQPKGEDERVLRHVAVHGSQSLP